MPCDSNKLCSLEKLAPDTFGWPLSVRSVTNQCPVWRVMDELMPVVSQNSSSPPVQASSRCLDSPLFLIGVPSPLCGRNHCRLAQTAVESMRELCVAPLSRCLNPPFFLCRLSLRVGGRAAPSSSLKFNTLSLSLVVSPTEFSLFIYFFPDKMTSACWEKGEF